MKKQPKLIGKIILAKFLEYSVERFIAFVSNIESSPLYKKLVQDGVIMPKSLAGVLWQKDIATLVKAGVIARVEETDNFSLYYTAREFSIEHQIRDEKLTNYLNSLKPAEEERKHINCLLNKVRRINTRNLIVHRILEKIVEHQGGYVASNNEFNLKLLSQAELAGLISDSNIKYPTGCCQTFDIGSAKNLHKRLLSHLNSTSKNGGTKKVIKEMPCVFRYLGVPQGWDQEEKKFYNLFVLTYEDSPQCNHMSPKVASKQTDRIIP